MAVAVANSTSVASGGTYTATAGSNRLLVYVAAASHGSGSAPTISAVTFGGVSMTQIGTTIVNATARWGAVSLWYIKEASIPAGSQTVSVTSTNSDPTILGRFYTLTGVDQTSPVVGNGSATNSGGTSTTASSASVEAGGVVIVGFASDEIWSAGETSACSGYTKGMSDQFDFNGVASSFHKLIASAGSEAPAVTTTASQHASLITASIRQVSAGGATATATPGVGAVTTSGLAPTANAFTNVRIREVLVNEAGSPVANQTGIHLVVWYSGFPGGAADLSYSNMTTDPAGTTSWSLATGTLIYNQRIFYVAHDGHASLSVYTCAQMQPTYS